MRVHLPERMKILKPHITGYRRVVVVRYSQPIHEADAIEMGNYAAYSLGPTPIVTHKIIPPVMCKLCAEYGCPFGGKDGHIVFDRNEYKGGVAK
jgi:hypothetical protein